MKLFEVNVDASDMSDENSEKIDKIVYSLVDMISELEEDGRMFKIIIEDIDPESIQSVNKYLH